MVDTSFLRTGFDECVSHVVQESGEVLAAIGKMQMFGPHSYDPTLPPDEREENIDWVLREMRDLEYAIKRVYVEAERTFGRVASEISHIRNSQGRGSDNVE